MTLKHDEGWNIPPDSPFYPERTMPLRFLPILGSMTTSPSVVRPLSVWMYEVRGAPKELRSTSMCVMNNWTQCRPSSGCHDSPGAGKRRHVWMIKRRVQLGSGGRRFEREIG